jgi:Linalool dehydratase/isomerase
VPPEFPLAVRLGPVTRRIIARNVLIYLAICGIGFTLASLAQPDWLRAFGLGLMIPGGGFLHWFAGAPDHAVLHLIVFLGTLGGFAIALVLWFATGNVLAPAGYWLAAAIVPAAMSHDTNWPGAPRAALVLVAIAFAAALAARGLLAVRGVGARRRKNALIAGHVETPRASRPAELSLEDLRIARVLLDRALQPLGQFDGFEKIDQFQTAALRYQLNFAGYGLSMLQYVHTPAFQGYLAQAQRNLIFKQLDHRIWKYWEIENLWGNLARDADPVRRDNIMFTGFVGAQIAMFEAASGSLEFDAPGSLAFVHPGGRTFAKSFPGMMEQLARNFDESPFTLVACEPNWVYPLCNGIGGSALKFHDPAVWTRHATAAAASIDAEFLSASGNLVPCRSRYLGAALPSAGGAVVQALPCFFYNAAIPALAERHWTIERAAMQRGAGLRRSRFWPVDIGNYRYSRASSYAATAAAAVEMGDGPLAGQLLQTLDAECPLVRRGGVSHRPKSSLWSHGAEILARAGRPNAYREMIEGGRRRRADTPFIAEASYPAVLVARAIAGPDGLHAVLYPGHGAGPQQIGLGGLRPETDYRFRGGLLRADRQGEARLTLPLEGRTELALMIAS